MSESLHIFFNLNRNYSYSKL